MENMLSLLALSWGEEIAIFLIGVVVIGGLCAITDYFRDWLVSVFKIRAVLDKLDEVTQKLDQASKKIDEIERKVGIIERRD